MYKASRTDNVVAVVVVVAIVAALVVVKLYSDSSENSFCAHGIKII